jgi:hypothetical protein
MAADDDTPQPARKRPPRAPKVEPVPAKPVPAPAVPSNGNKSAYRLSQSVVNAVAVVVTIVWGISFVADILIPDYVPPTNVHMALMVVLGGVFGSQFIKRD